MKVLGVVGAAARVAAVGAAVGATTAGVVGAVSMKAVVVLCFFGVELGMVVVVPLHEERCLQCTATMAGMAGVAVLETVHKTPPVARTT
jgi:hypothetical protein